MIEEAQVFLALNQLKEARRILIATHIRPDGDAIGSLLGLGLTLIEADKEVQMVCADRVPENFRYLEGSHKIQKSPDGEFDFFVVVDCSDFSRLSRGFGDFGKPGLNIDHHITNNQFAEINLIDENAAATAQILHYFINISEYPLLKPAASALLLGIITDTLGFRTSNMTSHILRVAADLMDIGANLPELYFNGLIKRSFEAARFWGSGLNKLEKEDRMVWTILTLNERKAVNYPGRDDADLINVLSSIDNMDISIIFVEQPGGNVKVSWRGAPGYNVSEIALHFGGGGHPTAAGAEIHGNIEQIKNDVIDKTREFLNGKEMKTCI